MPLTTSKVEETLTAIQGRKEYNLKKRQSVKDGTYDAEKDPEVHSKKSATSNGVASSSHSPAANGDVTEEFEHVGTPLSVNQSINQSIKLERVGTPLCMSCDECMQATCCIVLLSSKGMHTFQLLKVCM